MFDAIDGIFDAIHHLFEHASTSSDLHTHASSVADLNDGINDFVASGVDPSDLEAIIHALTSHNMGLPDSLIQHLSDVAHHVGDVTEPHAGRLAAENVAKLLGGDVHFGGEWLGSDGVYYPSLGDAHWGTNGYKYYPNGTKYKV